MFGLGVGGGCGLGLGLGWGVGVGWGSKYINQHFVFEETTVTRRSNDDPPQVGATHLLDYFSPQSRIPLTPVVALFTS